MNKLLINVKQLSESTGLSVFTLYSWINQKRIPYVKVERLVRFDPRKIEEWIEGNSVEERNLMVTKGGNGRRGQNGGS